MSHSTEQEDFQKKMQRNSVWVGGIGVSEELKGVNGNPGSRAGVKVVPNPGCRASYRHKFSHSSSTQHTLLSFQVPPAPQFPAGVSFYSRTSSRVKFQGQEWGGSGREVRLWPN